MRDTHQKSLICVQTCEGEVKGRKLERGRLERAVCKEGWKMKIMKSFCCGRRDVRAQK